jgi:TolB-like protein/class 3 adenylate cyclase/Tfp pilus assembly protein PilF
VSSEVQKEIELEIAYLLLIDVVGYSKLLVNEQIDLLDELNRLVRSTASFQAAESNNKLIRVPTGDGMALIFFRSPEEPARCAIEISEALKTHPDIQLRMGVHSGPINQVTDVNDRLNVAGAGINVAQRVMDCADAGHILLTKHVADDLSQYRHWQPYLHDLGEYEVKHGLRVHIVNLYKDGLGNPALPEKLKRRARWKQRGTETVTPVRAPAWPKTVLLIALVVSALAIATSFFILFRRGALSRTTYAAIAPEKSIAVLPFANLSEDKANAYFADGIQDEILTHLAKIADLKVISRTSTQRYKSAPDNLSEIAKQLGVAHILEGSVQKSGDAVRVNVQLIKAGNDSHLWAETYDRKLTDIFGVESEIAKGIAESLQAKLTGREEQALAVKPTNDPEAYDAYLRGLAFEAHGGYSNDALRKAISFYERAVQLDPNFALGWARLSRTHAWIYFHADDASAARRDAAKKALENAQKLQPDAPETQFALGWYQYHVLGDRGLAKTTFTLVSKILPGNSEIPDALAAIALRNGHGDESVAYMEQALALDPRNAELLMSTAWTYAILRQFPMARRFYDRALDILPNDPDLVALKATIYQAEGNLQEAAKMLSEVNVQSPFMAFSTKIMQLILERNLSEAIQLMQARQTQFHFGSELEKADNQALLASAQRLAGDIAGAKTTAEQARNTLEPLCKNQPNNFVFAQMLSFANAVLGDKDSAFREAERAIALLPSDKDRVYGPANEELVAYLQTTFSEHTSAISVLGRLLQTPYSSTIRYSPVPVTPALLRLDPIWDPLRADPAFQKLCEEGKW